MFLVKIFWLIFKFILVLRISDALPECHRTANFLEMCMSTDETKVCDSFYDYVCENFKKNFPLQQHQKIINMSRLREKEIDQLLMDVLDSPENGVDAVEKTRAYYKSCINAVNGDLLPLEEELLKVGLQLRPPFDVAERKELDISNPLWGIRGTLTSNFLIELGVQQDSRRANKYLPVVNNTPEVATHVYQKDETVRNALRNYIFNTVTYMYRKSETTPEVEDELIRQKIDEVINFLTKIQQTKDIDNFNDDTVTFCSLSDLQSKTDELLEGKQIRLNWSFLIENLVGKDMIKYFQNGEPIILFNEDQLMSVIKIISETKPEIIDAALWWVTLETFISIVGTKELQEFKVEYERAISTYDSRSRNELCVGGVRIRFSRVVGYILAKQADSLPNREKIKDMVQRLVDELYDLTEKPTWLSDESKWKLSQKIEKLKVIPSFKNDLADPEHINGIYEDMKFDENNYYANKMEFVKRKKFVQKAILRRSLRTPARKNTVPQGPQSVAMARLPPTDVAPTYFTQDNVVDIPIGSLGFPLYGLGLNALDYGIAATVIAHELTHMIDVKTTRYDESGNPIEDWRNEDESNEYNRRTQCFAKSFKEFYSGDITQRPNHESLLEEHIADFVGFELALNAYSKLADEEGVEKKLDKFDFNNLQLFTIAFAMRHCENPSAEEYEWQTQHSSHPPAKFRVNAVLRNTVEFGQIWQCAPGTKMNPLEKCKLWTD